LWNSEKTVVGMLKREYIYRLFGRILTDFLGSATYMLGTTGVVCCVLCCDACRLLRTTV